MAITEIKWKLVKDTYFFDTTTCYLSENGNHLFYTGKEKRIEILIDDLNELVRKGCAMWLKLGEYEFGLDKLSKCPTTTWYGIHQMLYSLEPWGVIKESNESARKSIKESISLETLRNEERMILEMIDSLKNNKKFNPYEGEYVICCDFFTDKIEFYYLADDVVSHRDIVVGYCDSLKDVNLIINELSNKFKFFESKKSARKSIKESERFPKLDEFKKFYATDDRIAHCEWEDVGRYTIFCEDDVDIEKLAKEMLKEFNGSHYNLYNKSSMPHLDRKYPNHFEFYLKWYESKKTVRKSIKENKHNFSVYDFIDYMIETKCIDDVIDYVDFDITQKEFDNALEDLGYNFKIIKKENPHDSIDGIKYYIYQYQIDDEIYRIWVDETGFVLDACLKY